MLFGLTNILQPQLSPSVLGGEGGTMGWVDLWNLVLPRSLVRLVEFFLDAITGRALKAPCIAVVQGCLKMVESEVHVDGLPMLDLETRHLDIGIHDWEVSHIQTGRSVVHAWEDWQLDCTAKASHVDIDDDEAMQWQLLQSGLLHLKCQQHPCSYTS